MTTDEPTKAYSGVAMALHWAIALLILINLILVWTVDFFPDVFTRPIVDTHKSIGITVLGLALLRVFWRIGHKPPPLPENYPAWEKKLAQGAHWLLYGLIFCLPFSGWLHDSAWKGAASHPFYLYGVIPFPRWWFLTDLDPVRKEAMHTLLFQFHAAFAYVLYAAVGLHVLGALKHQFWDREEEFQRMVPVRLLARRKG